MATSTLAPQTRNQPSRKGKKAWRKNVDIEEIQTGIENAREEETITGGKLLADVSSETLFQTDLTGDIGIQRAYRKSHPHLKADEIIAARSAVPAVTSRKRAGEVTLTDGVLEPSNKRRKANGVSNAELERLKSIAYGGVAVHKDVVQADGTVTHDPWAVVEVVDNPTFSYIDKPRSIQAPKTLSKAPISMLANGKTVPSVRKPTGGRSYNPAFADWEALVNKEGSKEVEAEKKRLQQAEEERLRQERIEAAAQDAEREHYSEYESEWEGIQSELDEAKLTQKRPSRKTQVERNKIKRRKEAERLAVHEKKMKERAQQARNIEAIRAAIDANDLTRAQALQKLVAENEVMSSDEDEVLRKRRFGGKHTIPEAPLEVVLADELQESLRLLKPEGNLLKDRFRNMLVQGKVEARRPISQAKKARTKATVKWSYKDWRLPSKVR